MSQNFIDLYYSLGRLLLLMDGDLAPFAGLTHRVREKIVVPKDGL